MLGNRRPLTFCFYIFSSARKAGLLHCDAQDFGEAQLPSPTLRADRKNGITIAGPENPIDSSGPRQRSWLLQPKFEHSSSGETCLLPPSAGSGSRGAETGPGRSTDSCTSSSTRNGAND